MLGLPVRDNLSQSLRGLASAFGIRKPRGHLNGQRFPRLVNYNIKNFFFCGARKIVLTVGQLPRKIIFLSRCSQSRAVPSGAGANTELGTPVPNSSGLDASLTSHSLNAAAFGL